MSILDDARRLITAGEPSYYDEPSKILRCTYCAGWEHPQADEPDKPDVFHEPDCPWLAMPRIVAALEAAQAVALAYDQETAATGLHLLGSPLLRAVDALDKAMEG